MISVRRWRERRTFVSALLFWVWLVTFIFGFVASDAFHTARCSEQWALASAHNNGPVAAQLTALPAVHLDTSCLTCLLQLDAQGILALVPLLAVPFVGILIFAGLRSITLDARALSYSARGPPVLFI